MMKEEKVSVSSKFWLCSADCLCGTLSGLITGGGMTYFYTKDWMRDWQVSSG